MNWPQFELSREWETPGFVLQWDNEQHHKSTGTSAGSDMGFYVALADENVKVFERDCMCVSV